MPDAVFFISDLMAAGALPVLDEAGIRVPQQMDILCHGDNEVDSFTKPTLSTTRMPVEEITSKCMELLLELIESKDPTPRSVMLDAPLIIRQSCPGFPAVSYTHLIDRARGWALWKALITVNASNALVAEQAKHTLNAIIEE